MWSVKCLPKPGSARIRSRSAVEAGKRGFAGGGKERRVHANRSACAEGAMSRQECRRRALGGRPLRRERGRGWIVGAVPRACGWPPIACRCRLAVAASGTGEARHRARLSRRSAGWGMAPGTHGVRVRMRGALPGLPQARAAPGRRARPGGSHTGYSRRSSSFISGRRRTRTAVARNTALASAGAAVGMARKLAPVGGRSSPATTITSTVFGSCAMVASG